MNGIVILVAYTTSSNYTVMFWRLCDSPPESIAERVIDWLGVPSTDLVELVD